MGPFFWLLFNNITRGMVNNDDIINYHEASRKGEIKERQNCLIFELRSNLIARVFFRLPSCCR